MMVNEGGKFNHILLISNSFSPHNNFNQRTIYDKMIGLTYSIIMSSHQIIDYMIAISLSYFVYLILATK